MAVLSLNLFSIALKMGTDVNIVLPDKIEKDEKLKCVWMYHGGSGDHTEWLYHIPLEEIVNNRHFAAVLPNASESCCVNMNYGPKYESYIAKELPSTIWNMFKCISNKRDDNYIVGFSNGGYGCLHTILNHPKSFSRAGAFSAGDKADAVFNNDGSKKDIRRIRIFGDGDIHKTDKCIVFSGDKYIEKYNDLIKNDKKNIDNKISIYHVCGDKDPWLWMNYILRDYFESHLDIFDYKYNEEQEMGHEWKLWDKAFLDFLDMSGLKEVN